MTRPRTTLASLAALATSTVAAPALAQGSVLEQPPPALERLERQQQQVRHEMQSRQAQMDHARQLQDEIAAQSDQKPQR